MTLREGRGRTGEAHQGYQEGGRNRTGGTHQDKIQKRKRLVTTENFSQGTKMLVYALL